MLVLLGAFALFGNPGSEALLDKMAGKWVLRGTIAGKATTHDVTGRWVLNRGYMQLDEVSRERDASGRPAYEALVYISADKSGGCSCLWLDTTSNAGLAPGGVARGQVNGSSVSFLFGKSFKTTFTFLPDGEWKWAMDGEGQPFARVTLTRP